MIFFPLNLLGNCANTHYTSFSWKINRENDISPEVFRLAFREHFLPSPRIQYPGRDPHVPDFIPAKNPARSLLRSETLLKAAFLLETGTLPELAPRSAQPEVPAPSCSGAQCAPPNTSPSSAGNEPAPQSGDDPSAAARQPDVAPPPTTDPPRPGGTAPLLHRRRGRGHPLPGQLYLFRGQSCPAPAPPGLAGARAMPTSPAATTGPWISPAA